jgi:pyroglutamyl-peptidase
LGSNFASPEKPDAAGHAPASPRLVAGAPKTLPSTFPVAAILNALSEAGFAAHRSEDAGAYVCNATLYRSLHAAPAGRRVGFVHVPPSRLLPPNELEDAAGLVLRTALASTQRTG